MTITQGSFIWYEHATESAPAADAFYKKVVGWDSRESGVANIPYTLFTAGGAGVAGLMTIPDDARKRGARPGWLGHVAVKDVDAAALAAVKAGGAVRTVPTDIPGVGRFAIITDPQGAALAVFRGNGEAPPAPPPGTPGTFGWHELHTSDHVAAFEFYAALFGWTKGPAIEMGPTDIYQIFENGGAQGGGMMNEADKNVPPYWLYYINVDAVDAAVARVAEAGGKVVSGPQQVPGGSWIVVAVDPQGGPFALVSRNR